MTKTLQAQFEQILAVRAAYRGALVVLEYDAATVMPPAGVTPYAAAVSHMAGELFRQLADPDLEPLLRQVSEAEDMPLHLRREAEELLRQREKQAAIPEAEYREFRNLAATSGRIWEKAKHDSDFELFRPYLEKLLQTSVRFAKLSGNGKPVYDEMLDDYERGLTTEQLESFFAAIRKVLPPLIRRIGESDLGKAAPTLPAANYPTEKQAELAHYLMEVMGLDADHFILGETEHPFSTSVGNADVRITTHYYPDNLLSSVYSVIHEGGHGLYMRSTADELNQTSLSDGAGLAIHESQSRLFENMIGRSREFLSFLHPKLVELFPEQMASITPEMLYQAANRAQPSLIRIEADELTYPLHILVRYELEKQLTDGTLSVCDLPEAWNRLYREYLGVEVPDDAHGVLQDMHWSDASFGYFPTYAVGSAYAAQIMHRMEQDLDVWGYVAKGELQPITDWLTEKIYRFGAIKTPAEIINDVCGEPFSPRYYLDYLTKKFSDLYQLD